jgi:transposase
MAKYRSEDLRIRVIRAVQAGASRRQAAERFGVGAASAVRWVRECEATGRTAPRPRGGDRRSGRIEAQADFLLAKVDETPDITLSELQEALRDERGLVVAISTLWRFFARRRVTFKKRQPMRASRTART